MKRRTDSRYVIIHGHFYQPPRENPWIEVVERQPSAAPHHDWNEVVTWECYLPNMVSRVVNDAGAIIDVVNNYRNISFNIGPTLLAWLERAFPDVYAAVLEADRLSVKANDGHGNAMAQAYSHLILPLANERDRRTQILWGIEDFRARFGRDPEGMWLPETAVNAATVRALVAAGIKFIVLAPGQAWRYRPAGAHDWHDVVNGSIDPRQAYRVVIEGEHGDEPPLEGSLAAFFYDGGLAHDIAFNALLSSSTEFADRIERAFGAPMIAPARLVNVATDGETYGHHRRFSDMALAYLTEYELPARGIETTNYGAFLAKHPPQFEVELKPGREGQGTSWSCAHGVDRWQADCGCWTGSTGGHQKWRAPMRRAFDALRDEAATLFEQEGGKLLKDPWAARDDYIHVILDRSTEQIDRFLHTHALASADSLTKELRVQVLKWLESQRHAMLMYTSCGWFFDEISRPEPVQVMLYSARVAQLLRDLTGRDLEPALLTKLGEAPGNLKTYPTAKEVYEQLVRPSVVSWHRLVAHHAIAVALDDEHVDPNRLYHYTVERLGEQRFHAEGVLFVLARVRLTSGVTNETQQAMYLLVHLGDDRVSCYVTAESGEEHYAKAVAHLEQNVERYVEIGIEALARPIFSGRPFTLSDLLYDERERLVTGLLLERLDQATWQFLDLFRDNMGLMRRYHDVGWKVPAVLRVSSEYALGEALADRLEEHRHALTRDRVRDLIDAIEAARALDFSPQLERAALVFETIVLECVRAACHTVDLESVRTLRDLLALERELKLDARLYRAQNEFVGLLQCQAACFNGTSKGDDEALVPLLAEIATQLGFDLAALCQKAVH